MDRDIFYYTHLSDAGPVSLVPDGTGYQILINKEKIETYRTVNEALMAAVTGSAAWSGGSLADLDLPGNLDDWQKKRFATISRLRPA